MPRYGALFGSSVLILFNAVILKANPPPVCTPPCLYYSNRTAIGAIEYLTGTRSSVVSTSGSAVALDVDVNDNLLFWSDITLQSISRINLTDGCIDKIVGDRLGVVDGLAVEWYNNFLYWTDISYGRIEMARFDGTERRILFSTGVDKPRGIALDPRYGYMFWTDWGSQPKIERATLCGQERTTIIDSTMSNMYWPNDIVIDYSRDMIYWVDAKVDIIGTADLDGNNISTISFPLHIHPFSIAIYPPVLFWSDWLVAGTIRRINKEVLVYLGHYDNLGTEDVMGITMFDASRQPAGTFSTCSSTKVSTTPLILETSVPILLTSTRGLKNTATTPNLVLTSTAILLPRSSAVKSVTAPSSNGPNDRHSTAPPSATTLPPNLACSSSPCQNGTCIPLDDGTQFRCDCEEGFGSERCSVFIGHKDNTLVNNVGRNLVSRLKVLFGGEVLHDTMRFDLFQTYHDLYLPKTERRNRLRQGISSENMRKLRTNAGDKNTSNAKEVSLAAIHNSRYAIPLDHSILRDHGVFYHRAFSDSLRFEITLASVDDIVVYSNTETPPNYTMKKIELEYSCISSDYLADQALASYRVGKGFTYKHILLEKVFNISRPNDGLIREHINVSRRSVTGILCLFTDDYAPGQRDAESFVNPGITSVKISLDGRPNQLYSKGMVPTDLWRSAIKRFGLSDSIREEDFYRDKFALWIDLRSHPDNEVHGNGYSNTRGGITFEMTRQKGGTGTITCHMFFISDAVMVVEKSNLKEIVY